MKRARVATLMLAGLFAACGDEPATGPTEPGGVIYHEPQPEDFFVSFTRGIETETPSLCDLHLSDDFAFFPTPEDSLRDEFAGTGVFDGWTRGVEISALNPLFADATSIRVEFAPAIEINKVIFARWRVTYRLSVTGVSGATREYRGVAHFDVRNESGEWRFVRWDEIENVDGYESWGYLRGTLRPRLRYPGKG